MRKLHHVQDFSFSNWSYALGIILSQEGLTEFLDMVLEREVVE